MAEPPNTHPRVARTSSRNVGNANPSPPINLEASSIDSHDDAEDEDMGDDEDHEHDLGDAHHLLDGSNPIKGDVIHGAHGKVVPDPKCVGVTTRPARKTKRRDSTVKRKEQNRIAQRAFRIRKKVYHLELETTAIEAADKIQDMADSNAKLMRMMEKLQKENTALKATQAKANLSSETADTPGRVGETTKTVKDEQRTPRPGSGGQRLSDAIVTMEEGGSLLADDPLVSLNDLQAGLNGFNGNNNKNGDHVILPVKHPSVPSPGYYETRWTDPVPLPSMTMPSWLQEQQLYPPSTTRPSTSSSGYTLQTRSTLSSPVAYIGSLPAQSSGRSGSSRLNAANAREQHIEVINNPTYVYPSESTTTPRYNPFGSQGQQAAAESSTRCRYSSEVAAPSIPDMTPMYQDQHQEAVRADSMRRYSRALQQHHYPRLHSTGDDGGARVELRPGQGGDVAKQVDFMSQGGPSAYGGHHGVRDVWTRSLQTPIQGSTYVMPQSHNVGPDSQPRGPPSSLGHGETYHQQGHMNSMLGGFHSGLKVNAQGGQGMMPVQGVLTPVDGLGTMEWNGRLDWQNSTATWTDMNTLHTSHGQQSSGTSTYSAGTVSDALGGGALYMGR